MNLFAHLFHGRGKPLHAQREVAADAEHAVGDCFPHLIVSVDAERAGFVVTRRFDLGEVVSLRQLAARLADQPSCDGPASSDFVSPFHAQGCARCSGTRSAGNARGFTRLRAALGRALVRESARMPRFVPEDIQ